MTKTHTCGYCHESYLDVKGATFAHNTLPTHNLRVYAASGAPAHLLRQWAERCEDALNARVAAMTTAEYEAAFAALPHISGEVSIPNEVA